MSNRPVRPAAAAVTKTEIDVQTDAELMNAVTASGGKNDRCFEKLAARHMPLILNMLRRRQVRSSDREILANSVLLRLWKNARDGKWDAGRAMYSDDPFLPLLSRIVKSVAGDHFREVGRTTTRTKRVAAAVEAYGDSWQERLSTTSSKQARSEASVPSGIPEVLRAAVAALPEKFRRVYTLHAEGHTNRAIATEVGCSWGEVSKRLTTAKRLLRETAVAVG